MSKNTSMQRQGLTVTEAQRVIDYVCHELSETDHATAERLLDEFVDQLRKLGDVARVKRLIEQGNDRSLRHLGGLEEARRLIYLVEKIGRE